MQKITYDGGATMNKELEEFKINEEILYHIDDFSGVIYEVYEKTGRLLEKVYSGEEIVLPISVDRIAKYLELEIFTKNLNLANPRKENQRIGELYGKVINIEETVNWNLKRYTIAHEIGHYMIKNKDETAQYALPLLASNSSELMADMYALFLMVPLELFLKEFKEYIDGIKKYPINITE